MKKGPSSETQHPGSWEFKGSRNWLNSTPPLEIRPYWGIMNYHCPLRWRFPSSQNPTPWNQHPPGNDHISHRKGKGRSSTQTCQTEGNMWSFSGGYKVGPQPVITWVKTPITRVITPVTQLFSAIYRGWVTPFITGRGPACNFREFGSPASFVPS